MEVRGVTPERVDAVEDASVVNGQVDASGNLTLTTVGGQVKNAGSVVKPLFSWPIGSIYIGTTSTDPAVLFGGGTWERFGKGRVLVGLDEADSAFNNVQGTGGAKTHTLTAAESGSPAHNHPASSGTESVNFTHYAYGNGGGFIKTGDGDSGALLVALGSGSQGGISLGMATTTGNQTALHTHPITVGNNAGQNASAGHNNLQPYIVVYMWRRTA